MVNCEFARTALSAAHAAWSCGDIEGMLRWYADDLVYVCNTENAHSKPFVAHGKAKFREFLVPVVQVADSLSVIEVFNFDEHSQTARARCSTVIRHRETGHNLAGTYRQIARFDADRVVHLEEFHDVARLSAFWRMVKGLEAFTEAR